MRFGTWPQEFSDGSEVKLPSAIGMLERLQEARREGRLLFGRALNDRFLAKSECRLKRRWPQKPDVGGEGARKLAGKHSERWRLGAPILCAR
jgi:hypothetical protein